ncbi:MAG: hypothetical protein P8099_19145 [Gemmatimonadota bacterium]
MSVPLFSLNPVHLAPVERALAAGGVPYAVKSAWRAFIDASRSAHVSVLVARWLADLAPYPRKGVSGAWDPVALIVVTDPDSENLRRLVTLPAAELLFLDRDINRLARIVRGYLDRNPFRRWIAEVRDRADLPGLLRRALLTVLEYEPPAVPVEPGDGAAMPRSINGLATRLGCSDDHLGRLARRAGIALPAFLKWTVALRALQIRAESGGNWETAAWRLGFAGVSGLSEHLNSTLGLRPTVASAIEMDRWAEQFERRFFRRIHEVSRKT